MELRFSIRYKILGVVTVLLIAAIGLYLLLAARIFKQDKSELVFELNKSVVTTLSTEVETTLRGAADKLKLYALIFGGEQSKRSQEGFKEIIAHDPLLVHVELFEMGSSKKMIMNSNLSEAAFLKLYNLDAAFFTDKLEISKPIPFEKIQKQSMYVWNATVKDGPALLGMGISVIRETNQGVPEKVMAAVGYLKADLFLQNLKTSKINQAFIIDPDGRVLVHTNSDYMIEGKDFSSSGIVNQLKSGQFASGVMEFRDGDKDELGAYAKINISGLGIISQVDKQKAFMAVQSLVRRSILFALIVITGTFIATVFFSRTLTRPLQKLLTAMERVARGELDTELVIKSGDEISVLAGSFNQMTKDLKQSRNSLQEINRDLESKVLDRTRKLEEQNRAVKEAQEALLRTTRLASVGEIAGRTAHEVLNPLTSLMARVTKIQKRLNDEIVGQKNLMSDIVAAWQSEYKSKGSEKFLKSLNEPSAIDPKMTLLQEDLGNISEVLKNWDQDLSTLGSDTSFLMQQASRIEKILGQMRNLSTISNVKSQVKIQSVVHDAVNVMADLFSRNKIILKESNEFESDSVFADRDELIQVLTNLLRNSLYAVCENKQWDQKRLVEVKSYRSASDESKIMIDVIDSGMGVSNEDRDKLFKSQFTTKSNEQGTGLGLSISRRFIRAFSGDLYLAESKPCQRTIFRIELPLLQKINTTEAAA